MIYREVKKSEYKILADIHLEAFSDFFLTSLGKSFLRTYYKASLKSNESIAICAVNDENKTIGFSIGCIRSKGYHKRLIKQNLVLFLYEGLIIALRKPKALFRLANNLDKTAIITDDGNYAELLSIGVSPDSKGAGIGKEMLKLFEKEAVIRGCLKIALTTDYENNETVLEFYKRNGYQILYEFTSYPNRKMYKLIKDLNIN
jgi:ribosomal protein S18 acetylase RimI-like enzyme